MGHDYNFRHTTVPHWQGLCKIYVHVSECVYNIYLREELMNIFPLSQQTGTLPFSKWQL